MYSTISTALLDGISSIPVQVELDISMGLPVFDMVGNLSGEVREAKERVKIALHNCGINLPAKRITVNLSPAQIRKRGTCFDLPIAAALLIGLGILSEDSCEDYLFLGELNLKGEILPVKGVLPIISDSVERGVRKFILPAGNLTEGTLIKEAEIYAFSHISQLIHFLQEGNYRLPKSPQIIQRTREIPILDFKDVNGQTFLKRASVIAAAGMHNMLLVGPPGAGKTMIAERIPSILPELTEGEQLELSKVYSVLGLLNNTTELIQQRPFRSPHHTVTKAGLIGGGMYLYPGEISLAHNGVLFLDELPEFSKNLIEMLREPMEDGVINLVRGNSSAKYPSDFLLLAAMNPCLCGYFPDRSRCNCTEGERRRYLSHVSQPILDRIDICVSAEQLRFSDMKMREDNLSSADMRQQVMEAFEIQKERYKKEHFLHNSQIPSNRLDEYCELTKADQNYMEEIFDQLNLTARTYHKILKVARTIADLEGRPQINHANLVEAVRYRNFANDRNYWGGV